jgi:hypothetical protein
VAQTCDCAIKLAFHKADMENQKDRLQTLVGISSVPLAVGRESLDQSFAMPMKIEEESFARRTA